MPFELVQAIQSTGVGVVGLDLRRTVVVLRSVDDQDVGETTIDTFPVFPSESKNSVGPTREAPPPPPPPPTYASS